MKIGIVTPGYYPYIGGLETRVGEISKRLVKKGFEVEVLTTDPSRKLPKEEVINGVRVKRFRSWAPGEAYYFSRDLKRYLMKNSKDYDVVHAHSYHAFPALYAAQAKDRNKLVFTPHYHGTGHTFFRRLLHIPYKYIARTIFNKADKIICVSNYEKKSLIRKLKVDEKRIVVIPNGVDLKEFNKIKRKRKDYKVILYVGRLEKYKGVHYVIKALKKLNENFFLEIVGNGPYKKSLIRLVNKLGVENRVRFYQNLPKKKLLEKYANADVFVMLSKYEAFCISVEEALASRTPCIVANTSALREWIDNQCCFGIDYPINVNKLARMITEVSERRIINIPNLTSWDEIAEKLIELYKITIYSMN